MSRLISPGRLLVLLTIGGLLGFILAPRVQDLLGIFDFGHWFLDSYAVLAANDARRAGIGPDVPNPLDVFMRNHVYSDWWFALQWLGLTRADNFLVGSSWVIAFLITAWAGMWPSSYREAGWYTLLLLSPPVLLSINRANNDLVVFALLAAAGLILHQGKSWRLFLAWSCIALAAGLKYYPVVAGAVFLLVRPPHRMLVVCSAALLGLILIMANIWSTLGRGFFEIPHNIYTFGAPGIFRDLGWQGHGVLATSVAVLGIAASGLVLGRRTRGLADPQASLRSRAGFVLGAAVLVACFLAGSSYAYRWIFLLLLAPWLWHEAHAETNNRWRRRVAQWTLWLLLSVLWLDGLFCFVVNSFFAPVPSDRLEQIQFLWRMARYPLDWALLALLAGWLLDLLGDSVRAVMTESRDTKGAFQNS
ncbi:MAG: hypothetical protein PHQ04_07785 [Opitutaceae bacterium]|nr:hypothetical protein [Opitutaceae bacterium]